MVRATCLALYSPIHNEVETQAIRKSAWKRQQDLCLPQWDPAKAQIRFYSVRPDSQLHNTHWGTQEPIPDRQNERALQDLDLIVVPGVVFDRDGYRLGYGYGGYDRILASYTGLTIGLAYTIQVVDTLPHEPHDIPCTHVITESGVL